jgi:hypothetical protein
VAGHRSRFRLPASFVFAAGGATVKPRRGQCALDAGDFDNILKSPPNILTMRRPALLARGIEIG